MRLYCPECKVVFEDEELELCPEDGSRLFTLDTEIEDPLLDATIDNRFRIESLLGRGGMGAVYRGVQLSVGREVAVKVLRNELLDREVALERFYRESKIISGLTHPNIVRLIDFGQDRERDLLYLVMELVDGFNMGDLLEQGRMRAALALEIVYQVCGALTEPHALGVIHRDLKPDNLLLVPISDGTLQVKVLDFGIARALEANTQLTATGMVCGTPQYMAPEQAQNGELGPPTDLYALGVMLYEMLCGIPPFSGQNSLQIMLQQIQKTPTPLRDYLPPSALPDELEDLVHDMLAKQPERRPSSAREVRDRIDTLRRLYDLDPVRLDPGAERELVFEDWILAKLPAGGGEHGHTEALRRETGLGQRAPAGSTHETGEREDLALAETMVEGAATIPLSDQARVRVESDGTRRGAGQAWTPSNPPGLREPAPDASRQDLDAPKTSRQRSPDSTASAERVEPEPSPDRSVETQLDQPSPGGDGMSRGLMAALVAVTGGILVAAAAVVLLVISPPDGDDAPEVDAEDTSNVVASEGTSSPAGNAPSPGEAPDEDTSGEGEEPGLDEEAPSDSAGAAEAPSEAPPSEAKKSPDVADGSPSNEDRGARRGSESARAGAPKERPGPPSGARPGDDASAPDGADEPSDASKPTAHEGDASARDTPPGDLERDPAEPDTRPSSAEAAASATPPEPTPPEDEPEPTPPRTVGQKDPEKERPQKKDEGASDETDKKLEALFGKDTPKRNHEETLERTFKR